jgi:acyl-coenzyme A synthetase/AMP-(fatty) acid ligase
MAAPGTGGLAKGSTSEGIVVMPSPRFLRAFLENVERRPDAPAVYWRGEVLSYRDLAGMAWTAAEAIDSARLDPGERLCVVGHKSPRLLALLIAAWRAGHPVLLPSPELGESALGSLAARAGARHLLRLGDAQAQPAVVSVEDPADPAPSAHGALLMLTTSGSTGVPKIVPLSPRGVDAFFTWAGRTFEIDTAARVLSYAPLNFDLSLLDVWTALAQGGRTVLVDPADAASPDRLVEVVTETRPTVVQGVPMLFRLLADRAPRFGAVRHVLVTGDAITAPVLAALPRMFPRAHVYNVYGCTETNDSTLHEVREFGDGETPLPIGRPLAGVRTRLVGPDGDVVDGVGTGELWVSTPFQAEGYLDPDLTRERFAPDPLGTGVVFYRTGDLVRRDRTGRLTLLGRDDFHVKVRGVRTNMAEVEQVLQSQADVVEAAVIAVPDDLAGNLLHAVVRRRPGSTLNSLTLRQECARRLARTAIPTTITIVDEPLPKTTTGKIDRKTIAEERSTVVAY